MRRSLLVFLSFMLVITGQVLAQSTTTSVGFKKPNPGSINWSTDMNSNFDLLNNLFTGTTVIPTSIFGVVTTANINGILYAGRFSGADLCASVAAAITSLPATGGTVDARGLQGAQSCASDPFAGVTKPVRLLLGHSTITSTVGWTLVSNIVIEGSGTSVLAFTGAINPLNYGNINHLVIRYLTIDATGLDTSVSRYIVNGTSALASDITLDSVKFKGAATPTNAQYVWLTGSHLRVTNNTFDTISMVAFDTTDNIDAGDNWFVNYITGFYITSSSSSHDVHGAIHGNHFLTVNGSTSDAGQDAILIESSNHLSTTGNVIDAALEHCIYVSDGNYGSSHVVVSGNVCAGWGSGSGIQVRGNSSGFPNDDITLIGNVVKGAGGGSTGNQIGFLLQGLTNLTATGNTAVDVPEQGFYIDNVRGGTFSANLANRNGTSGFTFGDTSNLGASVDLTVVGNHVMNNNMADIGFPAFNLSYSNAFANSNLKFVGNITGNNWKTCALSSVVRASNVVTATCSAPHGLTTGKFARLIIGSVVDGSFNGTLFDTLVTVTDQTHFTYPQAVGNASSSGGTANFKSTEYGFSGALGGSASLDTVEMTSNSGDNLVAGLYSLPAITNLSQFTASAGGYTTPGTITSTLPTGTAPWGTTSTTMNPNLNADMVDGKHAADLVLAASAVTAIGNTGTVTMDFSLGRIFTSTPSGTMTINTSNCTSGQVGTLFVTTSGTTAFTLTFGTNFLSTATLSTGTVTAKHFAVQFQCNGTTAWEVSRTSAM